MTTQASPHSYGAVVLTMGKRPVELARALESLLAQREVTLDVVVVGNGWDPTALPPGVRGLHLQENVGIPAGRNAGAELVSGEYILFLDDDSWLPDDTFLSECARRLAADPDLGLIQPRIVDPDRQGEEPRRWIPRLRKRGPEDSSVVFSVLETTVVLPRDVYDRTGGWPAEFFYAHEGIELAWRVWDQGRRVEYHGDLRAAHPVVAVTRHTEFYYMNARNRVWLARRNLRWPFSWLYVASWTLVYMVRDAPEHADRVWWDGWVDGWAERPWASKKPKKLKWATIARMGRFGRLPVI